MKYIIGFLTIAILAVGCKGDLSTPKGTVSAFLEAMKKGDWENAKKFITKDDLSTIALAEAATSTFGKDMGIADEIKKKFIEKAKNASYIIKDEKIDGDKAVVTVELKEDSTIHTQDFNVVKEDGSWKVSLLALGGFKGMTGVDPADFKKEMQNINIGDSVGKALDQLKSMNKDSLVDEVKKNIEKSKELIKNPEEQKKLEDALKKVQEATKQH